MVYKLTSIQIESLHSPAGIQIWAGSNWQIGYFRRRRSVDRGWRSSGSDSTLGTAGQMNSGGMRILVFPTCPFSDSAG